MARATTTEETRAELLQALAELGRMHPNWRLGQTLSNVAMAAGHLDAGAVWDLEDDEPLAPPRTLFPTHAPASSTTAGPARGCAATSLPLACPPWPSLSLRAQGGPRRRARPRRTRANRRPGRGRGAGSGSRPPASGATARSCRAGRP